MISKMKSFKIKFREGRHEFKISSPMISFPGRKSMRSLQLSTPDKHSFGYRRGRASLRLTEGPHCGRPLTQEELLRRAKDAEELNLRSLGQSLVLRTVGRGAEKHRKS